LLVKHAASAFEPGIANEIESEIASYINCKTTDDNPLEFWRRNDSNFKNLSLLAKTYLCASAASVPVEQMFSSTGLMLNSKRSSMAPYRANIVSVIHDNYATFFPITREQANHVATPTCQ
jgi:hypothetical protein